ncbi:peptidase M16 [Companilactobacillus sp. RD055328]|uniref:EF-P 5-aminopentanol modification-associated protein YfmF n=1 Tax=Companilactobacillus sp. RD055328 TaxID=2916634 RepID=UPI001FC7D31A|nr:insulinase family protein [Companilactobacillus sp. RD055328]GKQ43072.1 peptidase M16 [Companilactobacillus sp. RD055328]
MIKELANGIQVEIIEDDKFNTTRFEIDFFRPVAVKETTTRKLLSNILSHSCVDYPRMIDISRRTMDLYGADLNCINRQWSNLNNMNFSMEIINDETQVIDGVKLFSESYDLLEKLIFTPILNDTKDGFSEAIYSMEKDNLSSNLISMKDNKELSSYLKLWKLLFKDKPEYLVPVIGDFDELIATTNTEAFQHYQEMLKQDTIKITVVTNLNSEDVWQVISHSRIAELDTKERKDIAWKRQLTDLNDVAEQVEHEQINQSRLALGYELGNTKFDNNIPYQLFNLILGGDDQSLLFQNVREKNSLAYSVNSQYHSFSNILTIHAGIDGKQVRRAIDLINQQIITLKNESVSDDTLAHVKKVLVQKRKLSNDRISSKINRAIWTFLRPKKTINDEQYFDMVEKITKEDIQGVAKELKLVATYQLIGENS